MGTKYSSNSASGYNSTPPADDGTVSEANKVKWDTIKTKLADPVKTLADTINSELATHFDNGPTALSTNTTLTASHYNQIIQASSAITLTLTDASTLGAGWFCWIRNNDPVNTVTLSRATASNTFDLNTANYSIVPHESVMVAVNAAANGFYTVTAGYKENQLYGKAPANVSAALAMDIYSVTSGMVDVVSAASASSITSFTTARSGVLRRLLFNQVLTLTHNATSLILPGAANITTATGDSALMRSEGGGNWRCMSYSRSSGKAVSVGADQGSSLVLLASSTASSSATIDFTSNITSTYDQYLVVWSGVRPATDGDFLQFRVSVSSSFVTSAAYSDAVFGVSTTPETTAVGLVGSTYIRFDGSWKGTGNATNESTSGEVRIYKPANTAFYTSVDWKCTMIDPTGAPVAFTGSGCHNAAAAVDGIRFFFNAGNITQGDFLLYGVKKV